MICKTYHVFGYHEVEKLAEQVFGIKGWSFVADLELMNDVSWDTEIMEDENFEDSLKRVMEYITTKGSRPGYIARDILVSLSLFGHVPVGNILVRISW